MVAAAAPAAAAKMLAAVDRAVPVMVQSVVYLEFQVRVQQVRVMPARPVLEPMAPQSALQVVAAAVAAELKKGTDRDLLPTAPIAVVDYDPETDELALLQVDAEAEDGGTGGARLQDGGAGEGGRDGARGGKAKQKTTKDRNRCSQCCE